jgi:periplasmic protein CpxP/Spy
MGRFIQSATIAASTLTMIVISMIVAPAVGQAKTEIAQAKPAAVKESVAASLVEQLKLTDKQKKDIANIRRSRTVAINKILTPDQKTKFEAARKSGKSTSEAMKEISLKPDQKKQILEAMQKSASDIKAVLNPDQQKQLVTYMKNRQGGVE